MLVSRAFLVGHEMNDQSAQSASHEWSVKVMCKCVFHHNRYLMALIFHRNPPKKSLITLHEKVRPHRVGNFPSHVFPLLGSA